MPRLIVVGSKCARCAWVFNPPKAFKMYRYGEKNVHVCEPCYKDLILVRKKMRVRPVPSLRVVDESAEQMPLFELNTYNRRYE